MIRGNNMKTNLMVCLAGLSLLTACQVSNDPFTNLQVPPAVTEADIPADIYRDSWARLPAVQRSNLDAEGVRIYDMLTSPGNGYEDGLRGPLGMWMYSPEMAEGAWQLRQRVRYGTAKDQRLTELTIIATAREISNQYEYSAHEPLGRAAGLEEDIMDFVKYRRPLSEADGIPGMGEVEKLIIQFAREVISEPKVRQETFARAIELLGTEGVMDLTGLIGYYNFVAMTLKAFDVQRQPGSARLLPVSSD
jgi:4-carboxymuconolactone decarboxylase